MKQSILDREEIEKVIEELNYWQKKGYIKIVDYENMSICLRKKLEDFVEPEVDSWIKEWTALWPITKVGGYYVKQSPKHNGERMKKFLKEFNYSREEIFEATKKYIEDKEMEGWAFMKKSNKFIEDTDGSVLYQYCEALQGEKDDYNLMQSI